MASACVFVWAWVWGGVGVGVHVVCVLSRCVATAHPRRFVCHSARPQRERHEGVSVTREVDRDALDGNPDILLPLEHARARARARAVLMLSTTHSLTFANQFSNDS